MINYQEEIRVIIRNGMTPNDYAASITSGTIDWARARAATARAIIARSDMNYDNAQKAFVMVEKAEKILQDLVKKKFAPREFYSNIKDISNIVEDLRSKLAGKLEDTR